MTAPHTLPPRANAARARTAAALLCLGFAAAGCQTLPALAPPPADASAPAPSPMAAAPPSDDAARPGPQPPAQAAVPTEAADLWARLRRGQAMPVLDHPLVASHAQRFASQRFLELRADRIRLFLPMILEEIEQRGLPAELAMLPLVESALNPQARSPVGALGTWQIMAPTARRFELRTSRLVDDRKNLRQATRAALDYLQKLHAQFGDWHLAMAAYNWGEGRVQTAVLRDRAAGRPGSFESLAAGMPPETRNYVPQILALARLVADPQAHGLRLPPMPDHNPLVEVALPHDMDLALALRLSGMQQAEFLLFNSAVRPPLLLAAATPRLLMPEAAARRFEAAAALHAGRTASTAVVRLSATQTVDAVARQHGTSAAQLRALNDIPGGVKLVSGSVVLVPAAVPEGARADAALVASATLQTTPDTVSLRVQARPRETAADLARRCGVALPALLSWNAIPARQARQRLAKGRTLTLWVLREQPRACRAGP